MKKTIVIASAASVFIIVLMIFSPIYESHGNPLLRTLCKGSARCFEGVVDDIIDGDTLEVNGETIRLALINTPEKREEDYDAAISVVWKLCPIGSSAVVDEDDMQISRSHRRVVAVIYCRHGERFNNLNEELLEAGYASILTDFCGQSEFGGEDWAKLYGCG